MPQVVKQLCVGHIELQIYINIGEFQKKQAFKAHSEHNYINHSNKTPLYGKN
jgi:hypothetical protein